MISGVTGASEELHDTGRFAAAVANARATAVLSSLITISRKRAMSLYRPDIVLMESIEGMAEWSKVVLECWVWLPRDSMTPLSATMGWQAQRKVQETPAEEPTPNACVSPCRFKP